MDARGIIQKKRVSISQVTQSLGGLDKFAFFFCGNFFKSEAFSSYYVISAHYLVNISTTLFKNLSFFFFFLKTMLAVCLKHTSWDHVSAPRVRVSNTAPWIRADFKGTSAAHRGSVDSQLLDNHPALFLASSFLGPPGTVGTYCCITDTFWSFHLHRLTCSESLLFSHISVKNPTDPPPPPSISCSSFHL